MITPFVMDLSNCLPSIPFFLQQKMNLGWVSCRVGAKPGLNICPWQWYQAILSSQPRKTNILDFVNCTYLEKFQKTKYIFCNKILLTNLTDASYYCYRRDGSFFEFPDHGYIWTGQFSKNIK